MNEKAVRKLAGKYESFYLYEEDVIRDRMAQLRGHIGNAEFLYSIKCNPFKPAVKLILSDGFGADAASLNEVLLARECGLEPGMIYYSAPGKSREDIAGALNESVIIADSLTEVERIRDEAVKQGKTAGIGLRINPSFSFTDDDLHPGKFGVDQQEALKFLKTAEDQTIRVTGIHVHVKSQELDAEKLVSYYEKMFRLAEEAESALGHPLDYVNMGSGIGIPYGDQDIPVNLEKLGAEAETMIEHYKKKHPGTKILIESGRFLVGHSGTYVTHVADRKVSGGKTYVILHNTLNGFLRPSLARLVVKYSKDAKPAGTEPLFTSADAFPVTVLSESREIETVSLVGDLCTAADVIAEDIELPALQEGDIVCVRNAGSYAAVLSPMQFSFKKKPAQIMLMSDGRMTEE